MKRKIGTELSVGLFAIVWTIGRAEPALAQDEHPHPCERVRSLHPCSVSNNLKRQWDSELQQQDDLHEILEGLEETGKAVEQNSEFHQRSL